MYALMRYFGCKWRIAPWVVSHFPQHDLYIEPFGGTASVLFHKTISRSEIYNDINSRMVNLFRVLQDENKTRQLVRRLHYTLFSRDEYERAWAVRFSDDDVTKAWALLVLSFTVQGYSPLRENKPGFFCGIDKNSRCTHTVSFTNISKSIHEYTKRFKPVIVENRQGIEIVERYKDNNSNNCLIYCDPPYLVSSYAKGDKTQQYGEEGNYTRDQHKNLLDALKSAKCMCILSGYPSPLYLEELKDWKMIRRDHINQKSKRTTECLWMNSLAVSRLQKPKSLL